MTIDELRQLCDEVEAAVGVSLAHVIVKVPPRERFHRRYRVCKGLSGDVIGDSRDGRWTIAIKCSKVREFLKQFPVADRKGEVEDASAA
jgi:hypothetical protein